MSLIFLFRVSFRMINNLVQSLMYIEFVGLKKYKEHENDSFWIFVYWVDFSVNVVFSNIIWTKHKPKDYEKYVVNENKVFLNP